MKSILLLFALPLFLFSTNVSAYYENELYGETITHDVQKKSVIRGGTLTITTEELSQEKFRAVIKYQLKGAFIPRNQRSGTLQVDIPIAFATEEGYLNLEQSILPHNEFKHMGREDVLDYKDCHKVFHDPNNDIWTAVVYYHPSITSTGWAKIHVTLKERPKVPLISIIRQ